MIARELEAKLALYSGYQPGEIDQRFRSLRERDLIPYGPRGRHAPHLTPLHAALCLLTMVSRRAADAGPVMLRAMELPQVPNPLDMDLGMKQLAPAVMFALTPEGSQIVHRIEITTAGDMAWVEFVVEGQCQRVLFTDVPEVHQGVADGLPYDNQGGAFCGHKLVLESAFLQQIAMALAEDVEAAKPGMKATVEA